MKGVETYTEKKYVATIKHIEAALEEYYKEYRKCSVLCEGSYDHESFPDFYNALAGMCVGLYVCHSLYQYTVCVYMVYMCVCLCVCVCVCVSRLTTG